jgi:hypothetical protein
MLRQWIKKWLGMAGYTVFNTRCHYGRDGLFTLHNDHFRDDPAFQAAYARGVRASRGVDQQLEWRIHVALWAASAAVRLPGNFVECGVNAGFISSAIMHHLNWAAIDKRFYLIDTFAGPVITQYSREEVERGRLKAAEDAIAAGAYVTDLERIRANYSEWPNAIVVQGAVPDILPDIGVGSVAFLHIDLNCAYPERAALEFFWDRLSPGAFVLLDDYAYAGHEFQARAIDEAARSLGTRVLSVPTGQGLIIR